MKHATKYVFKSDMRAEYTVVTGPSEVELATTEYQKGRQMPTLMMMMVLAFCAPLLYMLYLLCCLRCIAYMMRKRVLHRLSLRKYQSNGRF